jgi:hypothetical protein
MTIASTNKNIAANMTADDIVNRGFWQASKKYTNKEHSELVMKIGHSGLLFKKLDENQIKNVFQYAIQLTGEPLALMYWILVSVLKNGEQSNFFDIFNLRNQDGVGLTIALYYLSAYDDKNDSFLHRAQRSVGVKCHNQSASQYFQDIDNNAESQQAAV